MQSLRPVFGLIRTVVPVVYCGGLLYYFYNQAGSIEQAKQFGLGPTLLGLAVIGGLFCIPLIVKIVLIFIAWRTPRRRPDAPGPDGAGAFDADAAVARYMARQSADAAPGSRPAPPAHQRTGSASRPSFGRKK